MCKTLSIFTLALALVGAPAFSAPVPQSQPQSALESLRLAANEEIGSDVQAPSSSASQSETSETSELRSEDSQQVVPPENALSPSSGLTSPPGSGQRDSEASES